MVMMLSQKEIVIYGPITGRQIIQETTDLGLGWATSGYTDRIVALLNDHGKEEVIFNLETCEITA